MVCQLKLAGVLVGVVGLAVGQAYGEGGQGHRSMTQPTTQPTTQPGAEGAMGEMMQQMMANMAAYGEAGPEHEFLKRRVGNWEHTATMWHAPGSEPMVTTGKTQTELIMGGRFLLDRSTGEFHGQTFEGLGIGGYDRIKKKYVGI